MSSFRPRHRDLQYDDLPPPPPPPDLPPLPPGPPPGPPPGHYRNGDSWRPRSPPRYDFNYRSADIAPRYPQQVDSYRPPQRQRSPPRNRGRRLHDENRNLNPSQRGRNNRYGRGSRLASNRPLLHHQDKGEMQMLGVTDGAAKYLDEEEVSDSEEHDMELSDSDREDGEVAIPTFDGTADGAADNNITEEPPLKRRDIGQNGGDAQSRPKWSNPDPYFVLPPVDETISNRKDPVDTIRKYRKPTEDHNTQTNQVTANDDFISFDMDGEGAEVSDVSSSDEDSVLATAPTAPRQMNPKQHSNGQPTSPHNGVRTEDDWGQAYRELTDNVGGRKRKHDDLDKTETHQVLNRDLLNVDTSLREEWRPDRDTDLVPWLRKSEYVTSSAGFRLHKEICDFFDFVRPQHFEEVVRENLMDRLKTTVRNQIPNCRVQCFGSFASGLYLPTADMDVVVMSDEFIKHGDQIICQSNKQLRKFGDYLARSGFAKPQSINVIAHAKVPLIKFIDRTTSIRVDMSFENDSGVKALSIFRKWKERYPAMPILVSVIKQFLMMRGLNEVVDGGIGGYTVICLITSLLQTMPRVQTGELAPEEHLGEILIEILDFYGNRFDVSRAGILLDPPGYFDKHAYNRPRLQGHKQVAKPDRLTIMDPNNPTRDIAGGSHKVLAIFAQFAKASQKILSTMKSGNPPSLLDWMLGGNYRELTQQRNHLRNLYNVRSKSDPKKTKPSAALKPGPSQGKRTSNTAALPTINTIDQSFAPDSEHAQKDRANSLRQMFPEAVASIPDLVDKKTFKNFSQTLTTRRSSQNQRPLVRPPQQTLKEQARTEAAPKTSKTTAEKSSDSLNRKSSAVGRSEESVKHKKTKEEQVNETRAVQLKQAFPDAAVRIPGQLSRESFVNLKKELEGAGFQRSQPGQASLPARPPVSGSEQTASIKAETTPTPHSLPNPGSTSVHTFQNGTSGGSSGDPISID